MRTARILFFFAVTFLFLLPPVLVGDDCPCVPLSHLWVVKTCSDWNCASTELVLGNGDPHLFALPVGMDDGRWLIVRRVAAGVAVTDPSDPFQIEQFDKMTDGVARYASVPYDAKPVLLTTPDGHVLVMSLKPGREPRRRASSY
jgi:hypothetical protein